MVCSVADIFSYSPLSHVEKSCGLAGTIDCSILLLTIQLASITAHRLCALDTGDPNLRV